MGIKVSITLGMDIWKVWRWDYISSAAFRASWWWGCFGVYYSMSQDGKTYIPGSTHVHVG